MVLPQDLEEVMIFQKAMRTGEDTVQGDMTKEWGGKHRL